MAAITHCRDMFKLFYGDEVVDGTTTQGTLEPFDQGEHFPFVLVLTEHWAVSMQISLQKFEKTLVEKR